MPDRDTIRYDLEVPPGGQLSVPVPLPVGSKVTVYVVHGNHDDFGDLLAASVSSTDFWDNPEDDEDWNDA